MKKLLIIIISLLIYSCSNTEIYRVTITQGTVFAQEDLDKLEIGMTKDQVSFVMGQPSFENFFEKFLNFSKTFRSFRSFDFFVQK